MADFVQTAVSKSAVRYLRDPIPNIGALNTIISGIISTNPWSCIAYTQAGENKPPVEKTKETYTGRVMYQNTQGKVVGTVTVTAPTQASFNTSMTEVLGNTDLETALGIAATDPTKDKYSVTLRCCHTNGDLYSVTFTRDSVRISSYNDDAVLTSLESWADGVSALN